MITPVVGRLDLAVLDVDPGFSLVGPGHSEVGACGLDIDPGLVAVRDRLVASGGRLRDHGFGLVACGGGLLELAIGLVAHLNVQDTLGDEDLEPLVFRLPAGVAGLCPLHSGPGRDDPCLGRQELRFGGPQHTLRHSDLDLGPVHGGDPLGVGLHQVGNPHIDQDIALLDPVADVVPVLLDIAGDPRIDRRRLEGLDRPRLDDHHPDVAPLGVDDCDTRGLPLLALEVSRLAALVGVPAAGRMRKEEAQGDERQNWALEDEPRDCGCPRLNGQG